MESKPLGYNQARLSQLRPLYKNTSPSWTSESLRIMPEPEENYLSDDQRDKVLLSEYQAELSQPEAPRPAPPKDDVHTTDVLSNDVQKTDKTSRPNPHAPVLMDEAPQILGADPFEKIQDLSMESIVKQLDINTEELSVSQEKTATVGTFNIEWLGTKKRTKEDYKNIAKVIKDTGASVLGIEEISNVKGLKEVLQNLPDFGFILGKSNNQMVGVIFDKSRVSYDKSSIDQLDEVTLGKQGMRPPLTVDMKVDNFDFNFTVMHLKARFDSRSIKIRNEQTQVLGKWLKNRLQKNKDKDAVLVGDYNDFIGSQALKNLNDGGIVLYATQDNNQNGIYSTIKYKETIDHGAITRVDGGASEEFIPGSTRTIDEKDYPGYLQHISDHKPMVFDFKTGVDRD